MSGSASAAPFQMPGHFWDAEKKRFFKLGSKPREPQPETHPTTSISSNASRNSSRSTKPNKRLKTERDVESSSSRSSSHFSLFNSFDSQLLNLRRSIHPAQVALSSIDSSISRTYKSNVTTQFMSKLSFSHKDTLPFSVGRHPITCFSNVVREKEKNGSTRWIYVGDSRGAVWQLPVSSHKNSRQLSLPLLRPDEHGNLYSSLSSVSSTPNTTLNFTASYLVHSILNPPIFSLQANSSFVSFLDSKGLKIYERRSLERGRLEPFRKETKILGDGSEEDSGNDGTRGSRNIDGKGLGKGFETQCFESLKLGNGRSLIVVGGDYKVQIMVISKSSSSGKKKGEKGRTISSKTLNSKEQIMALAVLDDSHILLGTRSGKLQICRIAIKGDEIKLGKEERVEVDRGENEGESGSKGKEKGKGKQTETSELRSGGYGRGSVTHIKKVENGRKGIEGMEVVVAWTTGEINLLVFQSLTFNSFSRFSSSILSSSHSSTKPQGPLKLLLKTNFKGHQNSHLFDLGFTIDSPNRLLAVAGIDRRIRIWSLEAETDLGRVREEMEFDRKSRSQNTGLNSNHQDQMQVYHPSNEPDEGLELGSRLDSIAFSLPVKALKFVDRDEAGGLPMLIVGDGNEILYFV